MKTSDLTTQSMLLIQGRCFDMYLHLNANTCWLRCACQLREGIVVDARNLTILFPCCDWIARAISFDFRDSCGEDSNIDLELR